VAAAEERLVAVRDGSGSPPWWEIGRAALFFVLGGVFLVLGAMIQTGHLGDATAQRQDDKARAVALLVIGALLFLPGSYVSFLAYKAFRGHDGWTFDLIPH
jgi:hypothetical protein